MAKFIKCGKHALSFHDTFTGFSISKNQVLIANRLHTTSGKFKRALSTGHIIEATEEEYQKYLRTLNGEVDVVDPEEISLKEALEGKSKSQLLDYYKENYELTEEEVIAFSKLNKNDMVGHLVDLEEE